MSTDKLLDSKFLFGRNLSAFRKSLKLKQYELAEKLNTSAGYLSEVENGKKIPSIEILYSLKRIFTIDVNSFFDDETGVEIEEEKSVGKIEEGSDIVNILNKQVDDLRQDKDDLRERNKTIEAEKKLLIAKIEELNAKFDEEKTRLIQLNENQRVNFQEEKARLLERIEELKRELARLGEGKATA